MPVDTNCRPSRLFLKTMYNVRDLGGLATADGRMTAYGHFLRADAPVDLDPDDLRTLLDFPVRTVIDLRSPTEYRGQINPLSRQNSIRYYSIPLLGADLDAAIASVQLSDPSRELVGLPDLYVHLIDQSQQSFGMVFSYLAQADPDGASLFHCSHGKDRTGLVAALLLMLAGVSDTDIIENYQISYAYLKPWFDTFIDTVPGSIRHYFNTDPQNMAYTLAYFHRHYQSAEAYLSEACGVRSSDIQELKRRLVN